MGHLQSTMRKIEQEEATAAAAIFTVPEGVDLSEEALRAGIIEYVKDHREIEPLPGIGTSVRFRLRGGEWRNGQQDFAAIVIGHEPDRSGIRLVVVMGADDFMEQQNVPRRLADGDWGWEPVQAAASESLRDLEERFDAFKAELAEVIFGQWPKGKESLYDVLQEHDNRLSALADGTPAATGDAPGRRRRRTRG